MSIVYLLYHIYEYGDENEHEELKTLGIYSSEAKAKAAIQYYKDLSGFSKYPLSSCLTKVHRNQAMCSRPRPNSISLPASMPLIPCYPLC